MAHRERHEGPIADLRADLKRYPPRALIREQSSWAVTVYRLGQWAETLSAGRWVMGRVYWLLFHIVETITGIGIARQAHIGAGLRIFHFGGIFIAGGVQIGENCTLRQGVTIGNRRADGPVPVLGRDVDLGAYAQVLGGVTLGDGCKVGAMSVVLQDVPPGATAVGSPARVIRVEDDPWRV